MPVEIYFHESPHVSDEMTRRIEECFSSLSCRSGVALTRIDAHGSNVPFVRIEGSVDVDDEDLVEIANQINEVIDTGLRFPWGPLVSRKKGQGFEGALEEAQDSRP